MHLYSRTIFGAQTIYIEHIFTIIYIYIYIERERERERERDTHTHTHKEEREREKSSDTKAHHKLHLKVIVSKIYIRNRWLGFRNMVFLLKLGYFEKKIEK